MNTGEVRNGASAREPRTNVTLSKSEQTNVHLWGHRTAGGWSPGIPGGICRHTARPARLSSGAVSVSVSVRSSRGVWRARHEPVVGDVGRPVHRLLRRLHVLSARHRLQQVHPGRVQVWRRAARDVPHRPGQGALGAVRDEEGADAAPLLAAHAQVSRNGGSGGGVGGPIRRWKVSEKWGWEWELRSNGNW